MSKRDKYTVYGWMRQAEKEMIIGHIPSMISCICLLYFRDDEEFAHSYKCLQLSENQRKITQTWNIYSMCYGHGKIQIPSTSNIICRWKVRIHPANNSNNVTRIIGISSNKETNCQWFDNLQGVHYAVKTTKIHGNIRYFKVYDGNQWQSCFKSWQDGDIISICLNLSKNTLTFKVNGYLINPIMTNIHKNDAIKYHLMVGMSCLDAVVEILSFTQF